MATYLTIAREDEETALELFKVSARYRFVLYCCQQSAEKYAKSVLESVDPANRLLKSHRVEDILDGLKIDVPDEVRWTASTLTSYYFNTRYPGDNYAAEVTKEMAEAAIGRLEKVKQFCLSVTPEIEKLNIDELKPCSAVTDTSSTH